MKTSPMDLMCRISAWEVSSSECRSCRERLQALYDGVIDQIEELEESQLEMFGHGTVRHEVPVCFSAWKRNVTVNPI